MINGRQTLYSLFFEVKQYYCCHPLVFAVLCFVQGSYIHIKQWKIYDGNSINVCRQKTSRFVTVAEEFLSLILF